MAWLKLGDIFVERVENEWSSKMLNVLPASINVCIELPLCASLCYFKTIDPSTVAVEPEFHFFQVSSLKLEQRVFVIKNKTKIMPWYSAWWVVEF